MDNLKNYQSLAKDNELVLIILYKNKAAHAIVPKEEFQSIDNLKIMTCDMILKSIDNLK